MMSLSHVISFNFERIEEVFECRMCFFLGVQTLTVYKATQINLLVLPIRLQKYLKMAKLIKKNLFYFFLLSLIYLFQS